MIFSHLKAWGIKTWQIEAAVAAIALIIVNIFTGNDWKEWIGAVAVFLSFMHGQITDRMRESQEKLAEPTVPCFQMSNWYLLSKEILWTTYFILSQTWSALAGVALFGGYPLWRKYYRTRIKPA